MAVQEFLSRRGEQSRVQGPSLDQTRDNLDMEMRRRGTHFSGYLDAMAIYDVAFSTRRPVTGKDIKGSYVSATLEPVDMGVRTVGDGQVRVFAFPTQRLSKQRSGMVVCGLTFVELDPQSDAQPDPPDEASGHPRIELGYVGEPSGQDLHDMTVFLGLYSEVAAQALGTGGVPESTWPDQLRRWLPDPGVASRAGFPE